MQTPWPAGLPWGAAAGEKPRTPDCLGDFRLSAWSCSLKRKPRTAPSRAHDALPRAAGRARPVLCRALEPRRGGPRRQLGPAGGSAPRSLWRRDGGGLVHGRVPGGPAGAAPAAAQPRRQPGAAAPPRRGVPQGTAVCCRYRRVGRCVGTAGYYGVLSVPQGPAGSPGPGRAARGQLGRGRWGNTVSVWQLPCSGRAAPALPAPGFPRVQWVPPLAMASECFFVVCFVCCFFFSPSAYFLVGCW